MRQTVYSWLIDWWRWARRWVLLSLVLARLTSRNIPLVHSSISCPITWVMFPYSCTSTYVEGFLNQHLSKYHIMDLQIVWITWWHSLIRLTLRQHFDISWCLQVDILAIPHWQLSLCDKVFLISSVQQTCSIFPPNSWYCKKVSQVIGRCDNMK